MNKGTKKIQKLYLLFVLFLPVQLFGVERWIDIDAELKTGWVINRVKDGWKTRDTGDPSGINKDFSYSRGVSSATPSGWRGEAEEIFDFSIAVKPSDKLSFDVGYEAVGNYADKLWLPINDQKRMELTGTKVRWIRGRIDYAGRLLKLSGFKGVGHPSWEDTDIDMFGFYPEQWEIERYRRISGRILPRGGKVKIGNRTGGHLTYITGEELIWGYGLSHYAKYNKRFGKANTTLFYKREEIPYGDEEEKLNAWQLTSRFHMFGPHTLQWAVLYQPFRVHRMYQYVEDVSPGTGILGSRYQVRTRETDKYDAWGEAIQFVFYPRHFVDSLELGYKHLGLVAGNKNEFSIYSKRKIYSRKIIYRLGFTGIRPLRDPLPLLKDQVGGIISFPRDKDAPFRVSEDPELSDASWNREKNQFDFVVTFDPTPQTWLFRWKDGVVEEWNINPAEDALFSSAFRFRMVEYPGTTDNVPYYDEEGDLTFVRAFYAGLPPSRGYLPSCEWINVFNLPLKHMVVFGLGGGQKIATTIYADERNKNYTNYLTSFISVRKAAVTLSMKYERDNWGPEDFHRDFGQIVDRLFRTKLSYEFTEWAYTSAEYIYSRRIENLDDTFSLGSFDEIRFLFGIRFGALVLVDQRKPGMYVHVPETAVKEAAPVYEVRIHVDNIFFSPDGDGVNDSVTIGLEVISGSVETWTVTIVDDTDRVVRRFSGRGIMPSRLYWGGIDQDFNATVGEGTYTIHFQITDKEQEYKFAVPMNIKVEY